MAETVGQTQMRSATASLTVHVQYPPSVVTMTYLYGESSLASLTKTLNIIEGSPFTIFCNSDSKPVSSYKWTGRVSASSATVKVNSTTKSHAGTITCEAENVMTRTFANPEEVKTVRTTGSFTLNVLYPPVIGELRNVSAVEGRPLTVSCPVTVGNPPQTTYEWRRNTQVWKTTKEFTIDTISRTDAMLYTCKVANKMHQTGEQPVSQPDAKSFYLVVSYNRSVETSGNSVVFGGAVVCSVTFTVILFVVIGVYFARSHRAESAQAMEEVTDANNANNDLMDLQPKDIDVNAVQDDDVLESNSGTFQEVDDTRV